MPETVEPVNHFAGRQGRVERILSQLTIDQVEETLAYYERAYDNAISGMARWRISKLVSKLRETIAERTPRAPGGAP